MLKSEQSAMILGIDRMNYANEFLISGHVIGIANPVRVIICG
jgi:hypothetical protein